MLERYVKHPIVMSDKPFEIQVKSSGININIRKSSE